ncbi:MAG TPA: hypothetical protein PK360_00045, partial [bacterium]|nr:hypothetical protein [bacterium]
NAGTQKSPERKGKNGSGWRYQKKWAGMLIERLGEIDRLLGMWLPPARMSLRFLHVLFKAQNLRDAFIASCLDFPWGGPCIGTFLDDQCHGFQDALHGRNDFPLRIGPAHTEFFRDCTSYIWFECKLGFRESCTDTQSILGDPGRFQTSDS